ncbi:MAG: amidophosphoribosyltransferase [Eubacteriales bacterium]|nr:amidophosphoribosyltransferase [Eubacteriales bacterium]
MDSLSSLKGLHEECGVIGLYGVEDCSSLLYLGLFALQHRGQEGCGMVTVDENGHLSRIKGEGLVHEVFDASKVDSLKGNMGIGHVRYATTGGGGIENVQPFLFRHHGGDFALAHNGNLVNSKELRQYLEDSGSIFQSTSDSEILAHLIKKDNPDTKRIDVILKALNLLEGSFAFLILTKDRLYAARDKYGLRPLSLGKLKDGYVVASETCAFTAIGATFVRDIEPGEVLMIDKDGLHSYDYSKYKRHYMCAMEYIYFARPDSDIEGINVHAFRKESGKELARECPASCDIVIGVPDSSLSAAIGFAEESHIPYEMGLVKSKYVGRSFIEPKQELRDLAVRLKLSPVASIVRGKRVALIDDSIVRGTTSKRIIALLRSAGAKEIHVRIASPRFLSPCFYGVDMSSLEELISASHSVEEVKEIIGADSLGFLSEEALYRIAHRSQLCTACFTGKYPTELYSLEAAIHKKEK